MARCKPEAAMRPYPVAKAHPGFHPAVRCAVPYRKACLPRPATRRTIRILASAFSDMRCCNIPSSRARRVRARHPPFRTPPPETRPTPFRAFRRFRPDCDGGGNVVVCTVSEGIEPPGDFTANPGRQRQPQKSVPLSGMRTDFHLGRFNASRTRLSIWYDD